MISRGVMKNSHIIDKVMVIGMGTPIGLEVVRSLGSSRDYHMDFIAQCF